jgi:thiamine pyrophosphate-dependent acetolactate synthase large subunit-like protein
VAWRPAHADDVQTVERTKGELDGAIRRAMGSNEVCVIDVRVPRDDMSPQFKIMSGELARFRNPGKRR